MIQKEKLAEAIAEYLEKTGLFLVEITVSNDNDIEITVDSDDNVDISHCSDISRIVEEAFNREEEDYSLTVGSAGLSQPFKVLRQYLKFIGKEVEVVLKSGSKFAAVLISADSEKAEFRFEKSVLEEGKKRKTKVTVTESYLYTQIKSAKPIINFR